MNTEISRKIVGVKDASTITGLSAWELVTGAKNGKYPYMRVGVKRGKFLFNIDMLNNRISEIMMGNCQRQEEK